MTGAPYAAERQLITISELTQRWLYNFEYYFFRLFPQDLFSWQWPPVWAGVITTPVILAGFCFKAKARFSALELYSVFYILLILSWPQVWSGERYILPIIYLVALYFAYAVRRLAKAKFFLAVMGLLILHNAYVVFKLVPLTYHRFQALREGNIAKYYPEDWQALFETCGVVDRKIPDQAVIVSRKPNFVYFLSGNRGFVYPFSQDRDLVYQKVREADYVLIDEFSWTNSTRQYLLPALNQHRQSFQMVYRHPRLNFYLLKVKE
jgi:hypothetical protein